MSQITRDLASVWHPCSQMKDYELFPPVLIKKAEGCYLETENGKKIIDASSSWWCKSLGHAHPRLKSALIKQIQSYEHVIGANTSQGVLVALSENLLKMMPQKIRMKCTHPVQVMLMMASCMRALKSPSRLISCKPVRCCQQPCRVASTVHYRGS